jgi:hypothetical protein
LVDPNGLDWGVSDWDKNGHRNYRWFNGKKMGKGYTAVVFGESGSRDIVSNGSVIRIQNHGIIRQTIYGGPSWDGQQGGHDALNLAAGHLHGVGSALTGGSPVGQAIVDFASSKIGGVERDSESYKNGDIIGLGVTAGLLVFITPPTRPDPEYVNLTKQIASEAGLAEILAGEGEPFAGAGSGEIFRDAERVAAEYGGEASEWAKVSSKAFRAADKATIETHAVQHMPTGRVEEIKSVSTSFAARKNN